MSRNKTLIDDGFIVPVSEQREIIELINYRNFQFESESTNLYRCALIGIINVSKDRYILIALNFN